MHLEFDEYGKARPDPWAVIDDFGTRHDALDKGTFGGYSDQAAIQRRAFRDSEDHDPDVHRAFWCRPRRYYIREAAAFASPVGMSIEADIRIDFDLCPDWDEDHSEPLWLQADGAAIRIISAGIDSWEINPASTVFTRKALEAFCWAFIEMEKVREDASSRGLVEAEQ